MMAPATSHQLEDLSLHPGLYLALQAWKFPSLLHLHQWGGPMGCLLQSWPSRTELGEHLAQQACSSSHLALTTPSIQANLLGSSPFLVLPFVISPLTPPLTGSTACSLKAVLFRLSLSAVKSSDSQLGAILPLGGYLSESWAGGTTGIQLGEARETTNHPRRPRTAPTNKDYMA